MKKPSKHYTCYGMCYYDYTHYNNLRNRLVVVGNKGQHLESFCLTLRDPFTYFFPIIIFVIWFWSLAILSMVIWWLFQIKLFWKLKISWVLVKRLQFLLDIIVPWLMKICQKKVQNCKFLKMFLLMIHTYHNCTWQIHKNGMWLANLTIKIHQHGFSQGEQQPTYWPFPKPNNGCVVCHKILLILKFWHCAPNYNKDWLLIISQMAQQPWKNMLSLNIVV